MYKSLWKLITRSVVFYIYWTCHTRGVLFQTTGRTASWPSLKERNDFPSIPFLLVNSAGLTSNQSFPAVTCFKRGPAWMYPTRTAYHFWYCCHGPHSADDVLQILLELFKFLGKSPCTLSILNFMAALCSFARPEIVIWQGSCQTRLAGPLQGKKATKISFFLV